MKKILYYINIILFVILIIKGVNYFGNDADITSNAVMNIEHKTCTMTEKETNITSELNINLCCDVIKKNCFYDFEQTQNYVCDTKTHKYNVNREVYVESCLN